MCTKTTTGPPKPHLSLCAPKPPQVHRNLIFFMCTKTTSGPPKPHLSLCAPKPQQVHRNVITLVLIAPVMALHVNFMIDLSITILYADDIVQLAPSPTALQTLVD